MRDDLRRAMSSARCICSPEALFFFLRGCTETANTQTPEFFRDFKFPSYCHGVIHNLVPRIIGMGSRTHYDARQLPLAISQQTSASSMRDGGLRKGHVSCRLVPFNTGQGQTEPVNPSNSDTLEAAQPKATPSSHHAVDNGRFMSEARKFFVIKAKTSAGEKQDLDTGSGEVEYFSVRTMGQTSSTTKADTRNIKQSHRNVENDGQKECPKRSVRLSQSLEGSTVGTEPKPCGTRFSAAGKRFEWGCASRRNRDIVSKRIMCRREEDTQLSSHHFRVSHGASGVWLLVKSRYSTPVPIPVVSCT